MSTPAPAPTPSPTPTPTPTPTPAPTPTPTGFDTSEYRTSEGPSFHNAITAWEDGITGDGSIIAVIDSGIDSDSPEFAGRIHPASTDIVGNRGIDGTDDHGTNVAMVAAAARDDTGIMGIAFDAQILAIRADDPGTCGTDTPQDPSLGCQFDDVNIAAGIDLAIASGAAVVNISLGGGAASRVLLNAITRASNAGVVVVVAAGNEGDGSDSSVDPNEPEAFATSLLQAGGGNVIIAGSVDENGIISSFSNRAGSQSASYLVARGEAICCVYDNGQIFVETINGQQFVTLFSGTSFSVPQISGAVALLAQAFPNLTGQEIVQILLDSARDAGAAGIDAIYGRGILDIAAAIAPAGTTTLAGTGHSLALADDVLVGSSAMGDAPGTQSLSTVILDKYDRAYGYDLTTRQRGATVTQRLRNAVERQGHALSAGRKGLSLAFTVADGPRAAGLGWAEPLQMSPEDALAAKVLAARVAARIAPDMQVGFAFAQGAEGMVAQLQGGDRPAFLIAQEAPGDSGFFRSTDLSLALRREFGPLGVTLFADTGEAWLGSARRAGDIMAGMREHRSIRSMGLAFDRDLAGVASTLSLTWLQEDSTILGGYFHQALAGGGADSAFIDLGLRRDLGAHWQLGASWRQGLTMPRGGGVIADGSRIDSNAWSLDLTRRGTFGPGDTLGLRVSQPLRVSGGGLNLELPVAFDYATESPTYGIRRLNLSPKGREVTGEIAWRGPVLWGNAAASLFYRYDPGHFANSPDELGALVTFSADF